MLIAGTIVRIVKDKGFGFIKADGSDGSGDVFFHSSAIQNYTFDNLNDGMRVEFELTKGKKGPRAEMVSLI